MVRLEHMLKLKVKQEKSKKKAFWEWNFKWSNWFLIQPSSFFLYLTPFSFSAMPPSLHSRNADRASVPSRTLTWWCYMTLRTPAQAAAAAASLPSREFLLSIHLSYSCTSRRSLPVFSLLLVLLAGCTLPQFLTKSETDRKKKTVTLTGFIGSFVA